MTGITTSGRDGKTGQYLKGSKGGPGRTLGSRNLLGEKFLHDLKAVWEEDGIDALRRCARDDATGFCRIVSNLMPRDIAVTVTNTVDVGTFAARFRAAISLLHDVQEPNVIEHADVDQRR